MKTFRQYSTSLICIVPVLMSSFLAGCGGGGGSERTLTPSGPTVTFTNPANAATEVALNNKILAAFSTEMDPATITDLTFTLKETESGANVQGVVTSDTKNKIALFTPNTNLFSGRQYTAKISTAATDMAANPLATDYEWRFTAGSTTDTTASWTVGVIDPAHSAANVELNKVITARFINKAMDPTSLTTDTFTLTGPGGILVPGTVSFDAESNTASFTPTNNLTANLEYTVTISNEARDLAGNKSASDCNANHCIWRFTTVATVAP